MASNLDDALFWVQEGFGRYNKKYFVKGSDFAANASGAEIVWVQRGDEKFWTYHSSPPDGATPDHTFRFVYQIDPVDTWQNLPSNQREQPSGDGVINFSYYFGNPGPYSHNEWKNIRNKNNTFIDLDGQTFELINNPNVEKNDIVRITHEGGNFEAWYVVADPDQDNGHLKFKVFNHSDKGAERQTCIKHSGARPKPHTPSEGHVPILRFDVYKAVEPYNKIRDTDWVWAQKEDSANPGEYIKYKVSGKNFKALFKRVSANFRVNSGTVYFNMKLHSGTANIMSMDNSIEYTVGSTSYKNQSLGVGNWYIPMTDAGGCEHFKLQGSGSITNHFQFLQSFNTSTVSNFERTFYDLGKFNEDVSMFNTSNATMMRYMFSGCREFNKSIDNFDTSNVENFYRFMYECRKFNQPILNLDTSKGRTFYRWFYNCREFNQHINHLDFSSVPNYDENNSSPSHEGFNYAFGKCVTLNQDITGITYNTHPYLVQTFAECWNMNHPGLESKVPFPPEARTSGPSREWTNCRINIANWTQPLPYICDQLFSGWKYFNQPVDHLDFTNCEVISGTFSNAQSFNHPSVANWDFTSAPKLTDVSRTFNSTTNFDIEAINQWNMTNIKGVRSMFKGSKAGTTNKGYFNLESWDMSNVLYMDNMFESSNIVKGISTWNTTNVLVTCQMFQNSIVSDDLSGWDVSNVFRATNMFRNWGAENPDRFKNWGYNTFDCNISNWNPKNISEFKNAFCNITSPNGYSSLSKLDLWRWRLPRIEYSHKINNDTWAADNWRDPWSDSYFESSPCFNMKVIEPGYEPVLTIRTAKMNDSNNSYIHIFGGDLHTSKEVLTYSRSSSRPLSLNNQNDIVIDVFKSSNVACTGGWIQFSGGSGSYWNENWEFAEAFGPHPELVNKPPAQFKHPFGGGDKSSVIQNVGGFEHLDVSDLTDLSVFFDLHYGSTSSNFGKVNIENWDVSNATNMDYFFGGRTNSSRMTNVTTGDLSYWCVQGVTSKPTLWPGRREDIVEKDPLWGQCPTPGSPLRPELPDGEWNIYQNVLWIESDDDATQTNDIIKLIDWYGWKPDAWARAREDRYSGWSDWESLGAVQYIIPDFRIEYIVAFNNPFRLKGDSGMNNINFINVKLSNQTNMRNMLLNLREFNSDISYWDVSNTTDMSNMFRNCKAFNQDLSGWDTRKVTNTRYYDYGCNNWDLNYRPF